jgi:signal transduction histidine kinase
MHQVLLNMLVNARDAMPGGGTLRISAENVTLDKNYSRMQFQA